MKFAKVDLIDSKECGPINTIIMPIDGLTLKANWRNDGRAKSPCE
jgi:hypothetical protein